ncbi:MAG TPA: YfdX family protein [Terriglobia bacterium]|nr:YfdX family protein [Terriglobia bacterium]
MTSEIRVRTYNLPLVTYPGALREAARLLDQHKNKEATAVLLTALNTLTMVDRTAPLPLILAQTAINEAQNAGKKNKDTALKLLADARTQLERAKELGYAGKDPEYSALNKSISDLEKQLQGNGETLQAFSSLKDRLASFFRRQSESTRRSKQG